MVFEKPEVEVVPSPLGDGVSDPASEFPDEKLG